MRASRLIPLIGVLAVASVSAARPVLTVNDTELTDTDLRLAQQVVTLQMMRENPGTRPHPQDVMQRAVDQLIRQALLRQAARDAAVTVDPSEVKAEVDKQRTRMGATGFERYLTNLGISEDDFTRRTEDQMVVRKFVDTKLAGSSSATEVDAKVFYDANPAKFEHPEEVKIRTILIKLDAGADEKQAAAAKERAELVRKQLVRGEDMGTVARDTSDDPSGARGGEIGWVRKGMLLPDLEPAVWALKTGDLSEVLKSKIGYHIFKLEDHRAAGKVTFQEIKGELMDILQKEKLASTIEALMKERRAKAKIQPFDPAVKAALENQIAAREERPPQPGQPPAQPPGPPAHTQQPPGPHHP